MRDSPDETEGGVYIGVVDVERIIEQGEPRSVRNYEDGHREGWIRLSPVWKDDEVIRLHSGSEFKCAEEHTAMSLTGCLCSALKTSVA